VKTVAYFVEPCPRAGFVGLGGRRTTHPNCANDFISQFYRQPASTEDHAFRWLKGERANRAQFRSRILLRYSFGDLSTQGCE